MAEAEEERKLKVFISYSRKDEDFAQELLAGLNLVGFEPYLDKHDIAAGEDWEARLGRLIEAADTVVFVISPDAVGSERCAWEVERTIALRKRLLPIVWRRVDEAQVPPRLKQLNYIFFDRPLMSVPALMGLAGALRTDLEWIREHTRIGETALRWDARGRAEALLLRGDELATAKAWLASQPKYAPEPTLLHHELIKAAEDAETARISSDQRRLDQVRAALEREQAAHGESEKALARERAALRRGQHTLAVAAGLFACVVVGAIGWYNQAYLREQYHWRMAMEPTVSTAAEEVEKASKHGAGFRECAKGCPMMIVIPAGSFLMGSPEIEQDRNADEGPQHEVTIPKAFAVSKFEVTFAEWDACVEAGACPQASDRGWGRDDRPAIFVSWSDANVYAAWLSRMTGSEYRLLSEAEWEYAARAGHQMRFPFGDDPVLLGEYAWHGDRDGKTQPVGRKTANAFGLHDMHGNVWEWVVDCWNEGYAGKPDALKRSGGAWASGDCSRRVVRGGSWNNEPKNVRSADRNRVSLGLTINDLGIRLARTLGP